MQYHQQVKDVSQIPSLIEHLWHIQWNNKRKIVQIVSEIFPVISPEPRAKAIVKGACRRVGLKEAKKIKKSRKQEIGIGCSGQVS